jgi:glycosyltransferase involved in cell wall biosynthesis
MLACAVVSARSTASPRAVPYSMQTSSPARAGAPARRRLLLVTHRSPGQAGGPAARWRSLVRHLPAHGWDVDVLAARATVGADEYRAAPAARRRAQQRARVMARVAALADPAFRALGVRPEAFPLSMTWIPRGAIDVRRRLAERRYDAVLATGPPAAALLATRAARRAGDPPLVVELRDLWASNPLFDRDGRLLGALERWVFGAAAAIVAMTPEAAADIERRHPTVSHVAVIPNGFETELLARRQATTPHEPIEILHSGTLTADRPLTPLLNVLADARHRDAFRLTLHGYVAPPIAEQLRRADGRVMVELIPPSDWNDAIARIARADAALVTQAATAGDATAVASRVYEYLALGRPVLCLSAGGATEAVLRRVGADQFCARLDDEASIGRALDRLRMRASPAAVPRQRLAPYDRATIARTTAELLDGVVSRSL